MNDNIVIYKKTCIKRPKKSAATCLLLSTPVPLCLVCKRRCAWKFHPTRKKDEIEREGQKGASGTGDNKALMVCFTKVSTRSKVTRNLP